MQLKGSCHCGAIQFEVAAPHPYPFLLCYCRYPDESLAEWHRRHGLESRP